MPLVDRDNDDKYLQSSFRNFLLILLIMQWAALWCLSACSMGYVLQADLCAECCM